MTKTMTEARAWERIAEIFDLVAQGKLKCREVRGLCKQIALSPVSLKRYWKMRDRTERHKPREYRLVGYWWPLTKAAALKRARFARRMAHLAAEGEE